MTPASSEKNSKRKREGERSVVTRAKRGKLENPKRSSKLPARRLYYKKVVFDGGEFEVGDDVYVKRREDAASDDEDPEVELCRMCFLTNDEVMIECDDCLGGFHLKCLRPPLKDVPEGDWICEFCEAQRIGKEVSRPQPPVGKKVVRSMREKLLSSDLWAAHIERYCMYFVVELDTLAMCFLLLNTNQVCVKWAFE